MVFVSAHLVEEKYGVRVAELARWRRLGIGPEYYRLAPRIIRYAMADVDEWFHDPANAHLHDVPTAHLAKPCPA